MSEPEETMLERAAKALENAGLPDWARWTIGAIRDEEHERRQLLADLRTVNELHDLGDAIYAVRDREGLNWEGPKVKAYGEAVTRLQAVLKREGA